MDSPKWETQTIVPKQLDQYLEDGWEEFNSDDRRKDSRRFVRRRVDINPQSTGDVARAVLALEEINRKDLSPQASHVAGAEILLGLIGDAKVNEAFRKAVRIRPIKRGRNQEEQQRERELEEEEVKDALTKSLIAVDKLIMGQEVSDEELEELTRPDSPEIDLEEADKISKPITETR